MDISTKRMRKTILSQLGSAARTIDIVCFEVSSVEVIELLRQLTQEGVEVKVRCEYRKTGPALLHSKQAANYIQLERSQPNDQYYALHEKLVVIDDKRLIFGTFNLSDVTFNQNLELLFETNRPELLAAARKQISSLDDFFGNISRIWVPRGYREIGDTQEQRRILYFPNLVSDTSQLLFSSGHNLFETIRSAIDSASRSITIYASHRIDEAIFQLLVAAYNRGVAVKIVKDVSALQARDFGRIGRGVTRYVSVPGKMHIKAILIDDTGFLVGSVNLFERSLFYDRELLFVGNCSHTRRQIDQELVHVDELSKPITRIDQLRVSMKQLRRNLKGFLKKTVRGFGIHRLQRKS